LLGIDISKKSLKNRYWRSVKGADELQEQRSFRSRGDEGMRSFRRKILPRTPAPPHPRTRGR